MDASLKTILFLGPTGSGKGTQADLLSKQIGFPVFSTGSRYREIRDSETFLGKRIRKALDDGYLMPSWFSTFLFQEVFIYREPESGIICEGLGRTLPEVETFEDVMKWLGRPYVVFCLNIDEEESVRRQLLRGRGDSDTEEKLRTRYKEFIKNTKPAIDYFRSLGKVTEIDGSKSIEDVHADVVTHLGQ